VHFPERGDGEREKEERGKGGDPPVSHHRGLNCYCKLSAAKRAKRGRRGDIGGGDGGGGGGGGGILSVAKLKYRAKVCTLDNAGVCASASGRSFSRNRQY